MKALLVAMVIGAVMGAPKAETTGNMYDVWNQDGLHLMMHDNGTPEDRSDDWVVDWEDNRAVAVQILDE